jgi:hypothetical protein
MEERLPGGFVNDVIRVGDTVRRTPGEQAVYVRELLEHFEASGWQGAPRHLGTDERGREVPSLRLISSAGPLVYAIPEA